MGQDIKRKYDFVMYKAGYLFGYLSFWLNLPEINIPKLPDQFSIGNRDGFGKEWLKYQFKK